MKKVIAILCAGIIAMTMGITSYAGTWEIDGPEDWQRKYVNDDGSVVQPGWNEIDGKWYHFDESSYLDIGMIRLEGKRYYLSIDSENLGECCTNVEYFTGAYGADGAWVEKEPAADVFIRWFNFHNNYGGDSWSEEEEREWNAQFAKYNITDGLFEKYDSSKSGNKYVTKYNIPEEVNRAEYYNIGYLLCLKLFMCTDGAVQVTYTSDINYKTIQVNYRLGY